MRRTIEVFSGACVVYVLVAACSGGDSDPLFTQMRGANIPDPSNQGGTTGALTGQGGATGLPASSGQPGTPSTTGGMLGSIVNPVPEAKAQTSGSRLKAQYFVSADGSRQFSNWLDTQLQTSCTFQKDTTGTARCFPTVFAGHTGQFMDSTCSQPVFVVPNSLCPVEFGITGMPAGQSCFGGVAAYRLKPAPSEAPSQVWARDSAGSCIDGVPPAPGSWSGRYVGELVPNTAFVSAQLITE